MMGVTLNLRYSDSIDELFVIYNLFVYEKLASLCVF